MDLRYCYVSKSAQKLSKYTPLANGKFLSGVKAWVHALECDLLTFEDVVRPRYLKDYDVFVVNVFPRGIQAQIIRQERPDAIIIGLPDPNLEHVIGSNLIGIFEQLHACDGVGGRTKFDVGFYRSMVGKPVVWMPSPTGPNPPPPLTLNQREDYILTVDHRAQSVMTAQNVAVCKRASEETGLPVIYVNPMQSTPLFMEKSGWKPEIRHKIPFNRMVELIRRARFGIDMYAAHSMNRHAVVHAALGTPMVKSSTTNPTGQQEVDPMDIDQAVEAARVISHSTVMWNGAQRAGLEFYKMHYSFEASKQRMDKFVSLLSQ